jgi:hypothetical protein
MQDTPGVMNYCIFGSAHNDILHMAMCDGSVHPIRYSISLTIHQALATRAGGEVLSANAF